MSFYAGKYNGKTQCHITKGSHDITAVRGAPFSNTVFHTDIKYMDYKIFPISSYSKVDTVTYKWDTNAWTNENWGLVSCYKITGELSNLMLTGGYAWSIFDNYTGGIYHDPLLFGLKGENGTFIPAVDSCLWVTDPYKKIASLLDASCADYTHPKQTYSNGFEWLTVGRNQNLSIIVWGLKESGTISPLYGSDNSNEIIINKNKFTANGFDLLNMKYLSPNIYNAVDIKMTNDGYGNTFQLIGSSAKGSSIEIISNINKTEIKKGGHVVLTSDAESTLFDSAGHVSTYINYTSSGRRGACTNWTYDTLLNNKIFRTNDVMFIMIKPTSDIQNREMCGTTLGGNSYTSTYVLKYNNGYIAGHQYMNGYDGIIWKMDFYGINGKMYIRNNMVILCDVSSGREAAMSTFGGTVRIHTLK